MEDNVIEKIRDAVLTEEEKNILEEEKSELFDYQQDVMNAYSDRIAFVGGRQVGKTELVIKWANENDADVVASNHEMAGGIIRRGLDKTKVYSAQSHISQVFRSGNAIVFDEPASMSLPMKKIDNHHGKILMVGSDVGLGYNGFIEFCKKPNTKVFTADMYDSPMIDGKYIDQFMEKGSTASICQEVEGKFVIDPERL